MLHECLEEEDDREALDSLSAAERAMRYREFATAALIQAGEAETAESRADYLNMAAGWHARARVGD